MAKRKLASLQHNAMPTQLILVRNGIGVNGISREPRPGMPTFICFLGNHRQPGLWRTSFARISPWDRYLKIAIFMDSIPTMNTLSSPNIAHPTDSSTLAKRESSEFKWPPGHRDDEDAGAAVKPYFEQLRPYLAANTMLRGTMIPAVDIPHASAGMKANAHYFSHPRWMEDWLAAVHRYPELRERWHAAVGTLDGKVLIDIGCGPGNLLATLGGRPRIAIGVDIAHGSLVHAARVGYVPLLADAHNLPLRSGVADIVAINGSLHHCDDMPTVLREAARLVRPGGTLILDHDPQQSAWDFRGLALILWNLRLPIYRWLKRGGHCAEDDEQSWAQATELHHRPGDGISEQLLRSTLEGLRFRIDIYPHNHYVGKESLDGVMGRQPLKIRVAQRLSGIDPKSRAAALSLLCVARREFADRAAPG